MADIHDISNYRKEINEIDDAILKLYSRRMDVCTKIGEYKKEKQLSSYDPDREAEVIEDVMSKVTDPKYADGAAQLFITLMQISCELQDKIISDNWEDDPYADF